MIAAVARVDTAAAARMREQLRSTGERTREAERYAAEQYRQQRPEYAAGVSRIRERAGELRAQLAAMSPAERAADAWLGAGGALLAPGEPGAMRLVAPDPAFYDPSRPGEVQAVGVVSRTYGNPYLLGLQGEVVRAFPWRELARMIAAPTP